MVIRGQEINHLLLFCCFFLLVSLPPSSHYPEGQAKTITPLSSLRHSVRGTIVPISQMGTLRPGVKPHLDCAREWAPGLTPAGPQCPSPQPPSSPGGQGGLWRLLEQSTTGCVQRRGRVRLGRREEPQRALHGEALRPAAFSAFYTCLLVSSIFLGHEETGA